MHIEVSTQAKRALKKLSPAVRSSIYAELRKYRSGQSVDIKKLKGSE
ncbi:MAG: type II toxin-antitoxin system RelE/ParE family toxin [Vulcanimicrobiota bacterium]